MLIREGSSVRTLLVTSACSAEGKTTVSMNLALSLARLDHRVLLIDGNMWHPCIQDALALPAGRPGLAEYLSGVSDYRARMCTVRPCLDVIAGPRPAGSPADLLSSPRMNELIAAAWSRKEYNCVIIDSPALLASPADVRTMAALADGVLFTVRHGTTPRESVALAMSQLTNVIGVVLNAAGDDVVALDPIGARQRDQAISGAIRFERKR